MQATPVGVRGSQRFSEFIEQRREQILREWVAFAKTLLPWAQGMDDEALRDHAAELMQAVVTDMQEAQSSREQSEKGKGHAAAGALGAIGKKHAAERLSTGFKLNELVAEYRALRASVLRLWGEAEGDEQGEITRFNEAIEETLAEAAVFYADELNRTREQFLAILGHDLRSPLSAMILGAEKLARSEGLADRDARIAVRVAHSGARMARMIEDLLDLTRTRLGGGIPVHVAPIDLVPLCELVVTEFQVVHPDREVQLQVVGDLHGEWDGDRLTQVLSNLVANALQYGDAATPVQVLADGRGDEVVVDVHNGGPPIPHDEQRSIFAPMVRRATSREANTSGLGLGLYIAHEVVAAHGGTIDLTSTEDAGTTFTVRVPRHPPK